MLLYPIFALALRRKFLKKKFSDKWDLHRRHIRWLLSPANLIGRITIAAARKKS